MFRFLFNLLLLTGLLLFGVSSADAAKPKKSDGNSKYASIVMDADTGMILSQRFADKALHPASLTKMMTLLMTFEALDQGLIKKSDRVIISNHAAGMVPSKLGLAAGSSIKVEDAIYALVTKSANDVAVALGEHIGGSESKFARLMTTRAHTIGMSKTNFTNASGLHDAAQVSSARDMAKMARYILQRYPHYYRYFSTKSFTYRGKTYRNHNRLMETYKGMDGFKTGYVNASGFNLVASAYQDGRRLIGVVFGGRSTKSRNDHMAEILDVGFRKVGKVRIAHAKTPPIPAAKPITSAVITTTANPMPSDGFTSLSALNNKMQITSASTIQKPQATPLTQALQQGQFGEIIGEGDVDPAESKRVETGLIAIKKHQGDEPPVPPAVTQTLASLQDKVQNKTPPPLAHPKEIIGKWAVQIGAFNSRDSVEEALRAAKTKLPSSLSQARAMAVPLTTSGNVIYRARFGNFNEEEARTACRYLKDCIVIAPLSTQITTQ